MKNKKEENSVKWLSNDYKLVTKKNENGKKKILIFVDLPDGKTLGISLYEGYLTSIFKNMDEDKKAS